LEQVLIWPVTEVATSANVVERRRARRGTPYGEPSRAELEVLILGTYNDLPGLRLHLGQAARLFGLKVSTCEIVLADLVRKGCLQRASDGRYGRGAGQSSAA
jgi:hypothetical protein